MMLRWDNSTNPADAMKLTSRLVFALFTGLLTIVNPAGAQDALDPAADPEAGTVALIPGFLPDPLRVPIVGGGEVDVNSRGLGQSCVGFISVAPDFRVTAREGFPLLRFIYISDTITTDTTLVVRSPDGKYTCGNNTFGTFNPMVDAVNGSVGDYAVWVGGFSPNTPVYGDLYITTNSGIVPGSTGVVVPMATALPTITPLLTPTPTAVSGLTLDAALPPSHGRASLAAGFLPDPYWTAVVGGGFIPVPALNEQTVIGSSSLPECGGYTDTAPDFRLEWGGRSTRLRFHFVPVAVDGIEPDASLIVQSPDGQWNCNRDFAPGFARPSVEFINPAAGMYHIWVADEDNPGTSVAGVIYVAEIASTPDTVRQAATLPVTDLFGLDVGEVTGMVDLVLSPDPHVIGGLTGGGGLNIAATNPDLNQPNPAFACQGFYSTTPTAVLNLPQPLSYLRVFFVGDDSAADPTLIVRMPDGQWYCGDDSFSTQNPTLNIIGNPSSGIVRVWTGSYSPDEFIRGTLYFTRRDAAPSSAGVVGVATPTLTIANALTPVALPTAVILPPLVSVQNSAGLDSAAEPVSGTVSLGAAITPHMLEASGGGVIDAAPLGEACTGFVPAPPDYRVQWTGTGTFLRFYFVAFGDTTLVVSSPDGTWHCNDDSYASVNPTVDMTNATAGTYNVWIGTFSRGMSVRGTLYITEDQARNPGN